MTILTDTNILLRLLQPHHPHCALVERAVGTLRTRNETLNVLPQNLMEFWAVATRPPSENGLGMTVENAAGELTSFQRLFTLLPETASVYQEWERLVSRYQVSGKNSHDAHIVAAMNVHAITRILTLNVRDFTRYSDISAVHPASVA
jgi:predicted nucleic acid-binding protein